MPIEIDCPECGGIRSVYKQHTPCPYHCKNGKITVYTEAEFKEAVKTERIEVDILILKAMIEITCELYDNAMGILKEIRARNK